jgi:hypothetical protein
VSPHKGTRRRRFAKYPAIDPTQTDLYLGEGVPTLFWRRSRATGFEKPDRLLPQSSRLSAFARDNGSAALAIAVLGIATKFNQRAEHFRPVTLEVRILL